ncbi:MAG: C40 family peptidase [Flavisolibacter sp.]
MGGRSFMIGLLVMLGCSCHWQPKTSDEGLGDTLASQDTLMAKGGIIFTPRQKAAADSFAADQTKNNDTMVLIPRRDINTKKVRPEEVVNFAETLVGTPYAYGSVNPRVGFDCSGFITYVFNHFGISVPRSSVDFTGVGKEVLTANARAGDLILFTGTNPAEKMVGHMGLVVSNTDTLRFIHSSSGRVMGVTITPLNSYYLGRFVKIIRIFP